MQSSGPSQDVRQPLPSHVYGAQSIAFAGEHVPAPSQKRYGVNWPVLALHNAGSHWVSEL
jgi:hypothetical protein